MQAVILAAGKGIRTYPLTLTRPKPLLTTANKTILEHNLEQLQGLIKEVIIVIGYKGDMIKEKILTLPEAYKVGCDAAKGLVHLHTRGIYHCDIKPSNLIWEDQKVVIIDFNVAYHAEVEGGDGGSRKYLPPEYNLDIEPTEEERRHRDLYALGISIYECVTGNYPWPDASIPLPNKEPHDPRSYDPRAGLDLLRHN